jgi:hypothetical protein
MTAMHNLTNPSTTQAFKLGDKLEENGNIYRYIKAEEALDIGDFVLLDSGWLGTQSLTAEATLVEHVGCAAFSAFAINEFGWVQTGGLFTGDTATSLTAGAKMYTSTTAGRAGANAGSDVLIAGLSVVTTTTGAGLNACRAVGEMRVNCS